MSAKTSQVHFVDPLRYQRGILIILTLGASLCYIGHGAFGVMQKIDWLHFFRFFQIQDHTSMILMPIIGIIDILAGIILLTRRVPAILLYMIIWSTWTALLRPMTGLGFFEFLERAGNYGVPLALLVFVRSHSDIKLILRMTVALLLIGHGGLYAIYEKPIYDLHWSFIFGPNTHPFVVTIGYFEIAMGCASIFVKNPFFFLFIAVWKIFSETLYPLAGAPFWEFVERFGSYSAPLALFILYLNQSQYPFFFRFKRKLPAPA